jgi:hypothetical protein
VTGSRHVFRGWRLGGCDKTAAFALSEDSEVDEFVLPNAHVHLEVMNDRPAHLWMNICGVQINVHYGDKVVRVADECEDGWQMQLERGVTPAPPAPAPEPSEADPTSPAAERAEAAAPEVPQPTGPPPFAWPPEARP